ncbi:hypothetical protein LTV02_20460 [Nocardia yamanashiensis]|uniref:hypothetical protein n=1 Tax=Nocardia yamanashiensis TaxID=209247 RepID=UPI001E4F9973|nr:hypothetical protein [Nocardia yamanashiensis]UGT38529.1 hypothetical protein LTV02_20460 [Nocardia yamanashiensis]
MSSHRRIRSIVVIGAVIAALGAGPLTLATATAAPGIEIPVKAPEYPLGPESSAPGEQKQDKNAEKAEKVGSGVATKAIDTTAGLIKCGLNFVLPSVKCSI